MTLPYVTAMVMWTAASATDAQIVDRSALDRNERSTPRSFVLPSSPAIAQEETNRQYQNVILRAQLTLIELGYDVDRPEGVLTAPTKAALFRFQSAQGLARTGELDGATLQALTRMSGDLQ